LNDTLGAGVATRSTAPLGGGALRAYRRLLDYLRPYRGRFILGISAECCFSATMASFALSQEIRRRHLHPPGPRTIVWVPLALIGLFILRGVGDHHPDLLHGLRRPPHREPAATRGVPAHPAPADRFLDPAPPATLLSRLTYNTEQIGQATTDSVIIAVRTTLTIIASVGFLLWLNVRLHAHRAHHCRCGLAGCRSSAKVPLLQPPHPGLRWRRHARRQGGFEPRASSRSTTPRSILGRQFDAVNDRNLRSNI